MSEAPGIAIHVQNLFKEFKLYSRPSDMFVEMMTGKPHHRSFHALQDVTFDVYKGQVVGILGRNGAGKSTLLRIISGTLDKTAGEVDVRGRISSILELGTGFSGEYTGRENIYLGGLMVGLSREEIRDKEDWIIEFSELREFIDQPFKTYSSGMQARLTFATAVCIDPDILVVDEALAVGDARFARKSFSKMEEFREAGRTILLVSHNTNQVASFCDHAIILERGQIFDAGDPARLRGVYYDLLFGKGDEHVASELFEKELLPEQQEAEALPTPPVQPSQPIQDIEAEYPLDAERFKEESGFCWLAELADLPIEGDITQSPRRSGYVLCEDGHPIGSGHAAHEMIRGAGRGLFSHWDKQLYFSTSDNSDPRSNGRKYSLKHTDALDEESKVGDSRERREIRRRALKTLGLTRPFVDEGNTHLTRYGNGKAEFLDFGILDEQGKRVKSLVSGKKYTLFSRAVFYEDAHAATTGFTINNVQGTELYGVNSGLQNKNIYEIPRGGIVETQALVSMWLTNGEYFLTVALADPEAKSNVQYDLRFDAFQFEIGLRSGIHATSIVNLDEDFEITLLTKRE